MKNGFEKTLSLGIQHVLAMYAGAIVVPLIVGKAMGLTVEQLTYLVSIDIFMCGVATLLQVWSNRFRSNRNHRRYRCKCTAKHYR